MQEKVLILKHVNCCSIILFFFASFAFAAQELKVGFIQGRGNDAQVEEQAFKNAKIEFEVLDKGDYKIDTLLKYDVIAVGVVAYDKNEPLKENFKVVNEYVEMLWNMLYSLDSSIERKERVYTLVLTHDVDTIQKYTKLYSGTKEIGENILKHLSSIVFLKLKNFYIVIRKNLIKFVILGLVTDLVLTVL